MTKEEFLNRAKAIAHNQVEAEAKLFTDAGWHFVQEALARGRSEEEEVRTLAEDILDNAAYEVART